MVYEINNGWFMPRSYDEHYMEHDGLFVSEKGIVDKFVKNLPKKNADDVPVWVCNLLDKYFGKYVFDRAKWRKWKQLRQRKLKIEGVFYKKVIIYNLFVKNNQIVMAIEDAVMTAEVIRLAVIHSIKKIENRNKYLYLYF